MISMKILSGKPHAGKDYLADLYVKKGYTKLAFATILKESVSKEYDIPVNYFFDATKKESLCIEYEDETITPRELLIRIANYERGFNDKIYITPIIEQAKKLEKVIISDCRFIAEIKELKKYFPKAQHYYIKSNKQLAIDDNSEIDENMADEVIENNY